jgi:2-polyprenyl-6-methoxyphenol hydroxylase-like FAD-dependent oxidoreductase
MYRVDVAILGGGPAGLSTAIGLKKAAKHLNVQVRATRPAVDLDR